MFRFGSEYALWLLVLVPMALAGFWWAGRQRRLALARFGSPRVLARLSRTVSRPARRGKATLMVLAVGLLATAAARPQFGTRVETVRREGQDVVVALDVSRSMLAEDIAPNRLEKAKHAVGTLISRLEGDRIGLVAFAGEAYLHSPLTIDYGAATMFLRAMDPDLVPVQGTQIVAAIERGLEAFDEGTDQHRVLVLITDGEDHEGGLDEALAAASQAGVAIHTVGLGSPDGVPIPLFDDAGRRTGFQRDEAGEIVLTRLDEGTLERIARETGGRYFRGTPAESEIDELADEIAGLDGGREIAARQVTQFEEQYQIFLGLALVLLTVEFLVSDRRRAGGEWKGRFA